MGKAQASILPCCLPDPMALVQAFAQHSKPARSRIAVAALIAAGAALLLLDRQAAPQDPELPSAFVGLPGCQDVSTRSTMQSPVAMQVRHAHDRKRRKNAPIKYVPWVEPTVPEELVQSAKEEGFRLRPQYNHQKVGYVVSKIDRSNTGVALIEYFKFSEKYGAYYKRSVKCHYHDEYKVSKLGDVVIVAPFRKMTKMKSWRLVEVMKKNTAPTHV